MAWVPYDHPGSLNHPKCGPCKTRTTGVRYNCLISYQHKHGPLHILPGRGCRRHLRTRPADRLLSRSFSFTSTSPTHTMGRFFYPDPEVRLPSPYGGTIVLRLA